MLILVFVWGAAEVVSILVMAHCCSLNRIVSSCDRSLCSCHSLRNSMINFRNSSLRVVYVVIYVVGYVVVVVVNIVVVVAVVVCAVVVVVVCSSLCSSSLCFSSLCSGSLCSILFK